MSNRPRMYEPGDVLGLIAIVREIVADNYVFLGDRPCHPSWLLSLSLRELNFMSNCGRLRKAELTAYGEQVLRDRSWGEIDKSLTEGIAWRRL